MSVLVPLILLVLALSGTPLFVVIAASAIWGFYQTDVDLMVMAIEIYRIAEMPVLIAIPLFTFAGYLLGESKAPQRLVRITDAFLGWMPGGLAIVALVTCALFTAFTGASGVTIVALGALLVPALQKSGYPERFNLGLVTTSGSLGLLFAPSLPLILYGVVAQQMSLDIAVSIDDLFLAGLLPGGLMLVALSLYSGWVSRNAERNHHPFDKAEAWAALKDTKWEMPLPFLVLGGIYGGWFAVSEAAAITAFYVLIVSTLIRREIPFKQLVTVMRDSMKLVGAILLILAVSMASTNYMIDAGVPEKIFGFIQQHVSDSFTFLLLLTLFLLILGMMLDIFSAIVIMIPIILPIAVEYGIHPIHLGILFLANMQLGYFTPPVGMNLFIASFRFNKPVMELYRATLPFFFILLATVLIITFWPGLSLAFIGE
ncbi:MULTISPECIES: TRAP transporter large permease [unclassified Oceanobacter]|uniref:TRAP transporter large permease n=1 Tax=unclassified Oceanobacter TaxID=2620260 RepID=UPI0027376C59|nr:MULTISPECIES: TRAP transporter large permease subunit [unclassified Oceanobacter]MDP2609879.1 TRAP transporter large permease subunit [Oceanobacter sp. 1_MG-2023]MDP2612243.1 TRAP transporter large permease subunit [Oceanobacter sp. 2_MG-2023]